MIETARLILRDYRETDRPAFAALNGDPRVGDWVAGTLDRPRSDALMARIRDHIAREGFGFWAAELKSQRRLVGFVGLQRAAPDLPIHPGLELGWRLIPEVWGQGLASEGAKAVLDWGFANLDATELVAITARTNLRSQRVMQKIGMTHEPARDFDHPRLAPDDPLTPHVTFVARR